MGKEGSWKNSWTKKQTTITVGGDGFLKLGFKYYAGTCWRCEKQEDIPGGENRVCKGMEIRNRVDIRVKMTHQCKGLGGDREKVNSALLSISISPRAALMKKRQATEGHAVVPSLRGRSPSSLYSSPCIWTDWISGRHLPKDFTTVSSERKWEKCQGESESQTKPLGVGGEVGTREVGECYHLLPHLAQFLALLSTICIP